jgi:spore maturation protein CgeB
MRVLLLGAHGNDCLGSITQYCHKAFLKLGCEVKLFDLRQSQYLRTPGLINLREKIKNKLPFSTRQIKIVDFLEKLRMNRILFATALDFRPQLIFTLNGERIGLKTLSKLHKHLKAKLVNWYIDPLTSPYHRRLVEVISDFYDYFFIIDSLEIRNLVEISTPNVFWLPMACDPEVHTKIDLTEEEQKAYGSDVCFVGTITPVRERILETLLDFDLKIWGPPNNPYGRWLKKNSKLKNYYQGRAAFGEELIKIYNAVKINLEIHSQHGKPIYSSTMRVFEVTGCGGFLLADYSPVHSQLYHITEEIICYYNEKDLKEKIRYYLNNFFQRQTIAQRGREHTYKEHTYLQRISKVLELIS